MISPYLIDIIILLTAAVIAVPFFKSIKLGAVPGFLIAGIIVGPSGLSLISNITEIMHLAEIGVVLLLFVIGVEIRPSSLWLMRRLVFGLGATQVLLTGLALTSICYLLFDIPVKAALLIGPVLALSSTAFVLQLIKEQKLLTSNYGKASLSVLLFQDLAVVPLLAIIPVLAIPELSIGANVGYALMKALLILGLVFLFAHYLLRPIFHRVALAENQEVFTASAVLLVLGTALLTEYIGLSMAMGAFLAGLFISSSPYKHQVLAEIHPFRGLLLGLFFISMGMLLNLNLLIEAPLLSLSLVLLLIIIKAGILYAAAWLFGLTTKNRAAIALILAQSGEFALVIFSLAYQNSIFTPELFQQLLLTVLLSMLVTPILAHYAQRLVRFQPEEKEHDHIIPSDAPIVIAGFGRVGRRIGEILTLAEKPFIAFDSNALVVKAERQKGHPVYYGNVYKNKLLEAAYAKSAEIIIVTTRDPLITEKVVKSLRRTHPSITIFVRGHGLKQCCELRQLGASGAVSETIEASIELTRMTLNHLEVEKEKQAIILNDFREAHHDEINNAANINDEGSNN